jgi:hypothetical protein
MPKPMAKYSLKRGKRNRFPWGGGTTRLIYLIAQEVGRARAKKGMAIFAGFSQICRFSETINRVGPGFPNLFGIYLFPKTG